tara:strand:- start:135 stop:611 length:477 start_codon:yes stop_codon:yes gene_type:complete
MEQNKDNFKNKLSFGQEGEKDIALKLIEKGFYILPLYQFKDEIAPQIIGEKQTIISPDLICFKDGKVVYFEVKSKNKWVDYKGVLETGCNYKHYEHYKKLSLETKIKLYIVFNHVSGKEQGIYLVDVLKDGRYWDGKVKNKQIYKPEYFWNKKQLIKL